MELFFVFSFVTALCLSSICSLVESTLYSVPVSYLRHRVKEDNSYSAQVMLGIKKDMSKAIAAVLIVNTTANTAGSAVSGWAAAELFGSTGLAIFSILFTIAILYAGEIIPKYLGVVYCRPLSLTIARPLALLIRALRPLVWISEKVSKLFKRNNTNAMTTEEVLSIASSALEDGALDKLEGSVISNVIGLDETMVKDILTPRVVVFRLDETTLVAEVEKEIKDWSHSRIPLFSNQDPDQLTSYVTQRDIYSALLSGQRDLPLSQLSRPLKVTPELIRLDKLLLEMFAEREHICSVVDEHGGLAGIVTLEDIIEEIVGNEIVDEYDSVSDLRTYAKQLNLVRTKLGRRKD